MTSMGFIKNTPISKNNQTTIVPETFTHSCAIGQTGCGKTTSYIYPNIHNRIKNDHALIVFDYKGKEHMAVKAIAAQCDRLDDIVEIGKDWGQSINILKYMNNATLENFLSELYGLNNSENEYWGRSATNISLSILNIIGQIEKLLLKAKEKDLYEVIEKAIESYYAYDYPTSKTLYSLSLVVKSVDSLKEFVENLTIFHSSIYADLKKSVKQDLDKLDQKQIRKKYQNIMYVMEQFQREINKEKKNLSSFDGFSDKSSSKTLHSIILAINTPLMNIASIKWLNDDQFDIVNSLNDKKIIIINTKAFSQTILASYSNAVLTELTKRTSMTNVVPISIFADEAQRIMSNKSDLPIDVLREAKVELFLAFQNEELMIQALGETKYISLIKNLKHQFVYKNLGFYNDYDLSKLDTFEYYINEENPKINKASAVFLEKKEFFDAELQYQHNIKLHKRFSLNKVDQRKIILYNEHALKDNTVQLMDRREKIYSRDFLDEEIVNEALYNLDVMITEIKHVDDENDDFDYFAEMVDDFTDEVDF